MSRDPSLDIVKRHGGRQNRDGLLFSVVNDLDKRVDKQERSGGGFITYGPYTTGAVSVAAAAETAFDMAIDSAAYNAGVNTPGKVVINSGIIGTGGAYDWLTYGINFPAVNTLRVWIRNTDGSVAANFTFTAAVMVWV